MTEISASQATAFMLSAIVPSAPIFMVAFNLGAYDTVFFEHLFVMWAASIAALMAGIVVGRTKDGRSWIPWYGIILLAMPSLWILEELLLQGSDVGFADWASAVLSFVSVVFSLPYVLYFVVLALVPSIDRLRAPRLVVGLGVIWAIVFAAGYIAGARHYWVLTCDDFVVSGSFTPDGCFEG